MQQRQKGFPTDSASRLVTCQRDTILSPLEENGDGLSRLRDMEPSLVPYPDCLNEGRLRPGLVVPTTVLNKDWNQSIDDLKEAECMDDAQSRLYSLPLAAPPQAPPQPQSQLPLSSHQTTISTLLDPERELDLSQWRPQQQQPRPPARTLFAPAKSSIGPPPRTNVAPSSTSIVCNSLAEPPPTLGPINLSTALGQRLPASVASQNSRAALSTLTAPDRPLSSQRLTLYDIRHATELLPVVSTSLPGLGPGFGPKDHAPDISSVACQVSTRLSAKNNLDKGDPIHPSMASPCSRQSSRPSATGPPSGTLSAPPIIHSTRLPRPTTELRSNMGVPPSIDLALTAIGQPTLAGPLTSVTANHPPFTRRGPLLHHPRATSGPQQSSLFKSIRRFVSQVGPNQPPASPHPSPSAQSPKLSPVTDISHPLAQRDPSSRISTSASVSSLHSDATRLTAAPKSQTLSSSRTTVDLTDAVQESAMDLTPLLDDMTGSSSGLTKVGSVWTFTSKDLFSPSSRSNQLKTPLKQNHLALPVAATRTENHPGLPLANFPSRPPKPSFLDNALLKSASRHELGTQQSQLPLQQQRGLKQEQQEDEEELLQGPTPIQDRLIARGTHIPHSESFTFDSPPLPPLPPPRVVPNTSVQRSSSPAAESFESDHPTPSSSPHPLGNHPASLSPPCPHLSTHKVVLRKSSSLPRLLPQSDHQTCPPHLIPAQPALTPGLAVDSEPPPNALGSQYDSSPCHHQQPSQFSQSSPAASPPANHLALLHFEPQQQHQLERLDHSLDQGPMSPVLGAPAVSRSRRSVLCLPRPKAARLESSPSSQSYLSEFSNCPPPSYRGPPQFLDSLNHAAADSQSIFNLTSPSTPRSNPHTDSYSNFRSPQPLSCTPGPNVPPAALLPPTLSLPPTPALNHSFHFPVSPTKPLPPLPDQTPFNLQHDQAEVRPDDPADSSDQLGNPVPHQNSEPFDSPGHLHLISAFHHPHLARPLERIASTISSSSSSSVEWEHSIGSFAHFANNLAPELRQMLSHQLRNEASFLVTHLPVAPSSCSTCFQRLNLPLTEGHSLVAPASKASMWSNAAKSHRNYVSIQASTPHQHESLPDDGSRSHPYSHPIELTTPAIERKRTTTLAATTRSFSHLPSLEHHKIVSAAALDKMVAGPKSTEATAVSCPPDGRKIRPIIAGCDLSSSLPGSSRPTPSPVTLPSTTTRTLSTSITTTALTGSHIDGIRSLRLHRVPEQIPSHVSVATSYSSARARHRETNSSNIRQIASSDQTQDQSEPHPILHHHGEHQQLTVIVCPTGPRVQPPTTTTTQGSFDIGQSSPHPQQQSIPAQSSQVSAHLPSATAGFPPRSENRIESCFGSDLLSNLFANPIPSAIFELPTIPIAEKPQANISSRAFREPVSPQPFLVAHGLNDPAFLAFPTPYEFVPSTALVHQPNLQSDPHQPQSVIQHGVPAHPSTAAGLSQVPPAQRQLSMTGHTFSSHAQDTTDQINLPLPPPGVSSGDSSLSMLSSGALFTLSASNLAPLSPALYPTHHQPASATHASLLQPRHSGSLSFLSQNSVAGSTGPPISTHTLRQQQQQQQYQFYLEFLRWSNTLAATNPYIQQFLSQDRRHLSPIIAPSTLSDLVPLSSAGLPIAASAGPLPSQFPSAPSLTTSISLLRPPSLTSPDTPNFSELITPPQHQPLVQPYLISTPSRFLVIQDVDFNVHSTEPDPGPNHHHTK